ncbi:extracellular solute-binding protein [Paenibacillus sp. CC-CFT747]|nr:extracellular solute-binding protein [Paenibacillus sp. CC-CFT747]
MKRKGSVLSLAAMSVWMLAACTPGGGGSGSTPTAASANGTNPQPVQLRMSWWGSQVRHDATMKVIDLFQKKYPNIKVNAEYMGSEGYWDKLNTQVAGGNAPDLIQVGNNYPDYVAKGALLDISSYLGKEINMDDFSKASIDSGRLDGKLYGVVLGMNAFGVAYNTELVKKAGLQPPTDKWTWEEFGKYAADLTKALGKGSYGSVDESWLNTLYLTYFARQDNKTLYKDGKVGLDKAELEKWFTMWENFRKAGAVGPASFSAGYTESPDNSSFVQGKTALKVIWSNQVSAYQKVMKDEIKLVMPPGEVPERLRVYGCSRVNS